MRTFFLWVLLPIGVLCILVLSLSLTKDTLTIINVTPYQFSIGEHITIHGSGFGQQRDDGEVRINNTPLKPIEYISWNNNEIIIRAPNDVQNGTLAVARRESESNIVFINQVDYITPETESATSSAVQIVSHTPLAPSGGDVVRFEGIFTGYPRLRFLFRVHVDESTGIAYYEVPAHDILMRSPHSFSIRLPSGISSGDMRVMAEDVVLDNYYLEIDSHLGVITYHNAQSHIVNYGARLNGVSDAYGVWLPLIPRTLAQPTHDLLFVSEQFEFAFRDNGYFFVTPRASPLPISVRILAKVSRFEKRSVINPRALTPSPNLASYQLEQYVANRMWLAVNSDRAQSEVGEFIAIPNIYLRAQAIYQLVLSHLTPQMDEAVFRSLIPSSADSDELIGFQHIARMLERISSEEDVQASAVEYALLAETLMRTAGIPSRIVTGVYFILDNASEKRAITHYWNEFFLPQFGWIPIDIAMGDGMYPNSLVEESADAFYFGNLDGRRIELSRDIQTLPHHHRDGVRDSFNRSYLLFSHSIDATRDLDDEAFYLYPINVIN